MHVQFLNWEDPWSRMTTHSSLLPENPMNRVILEGNSPGGPEETDTTEHALMHLHLIYGWVLFVDRVELLEVSASSKIF